MMKKLFVFPILLVLMLLIVSCEEDNDVCEAFEPTTCDILATFCSDGEFGYYEYDGNKYICADEECVQATEDVYKAAGCLGSTATIKLTSEHYIYASTVVKRVFEEARASCAGCN